MVTKVKAVRPDGGIWLGAKLVKLAELQPNAKISVDIDGGVIVIKATGEEAAKVAKPAKE